MRQWSKKLKPKLNLEGDYQARVDTGQMILMIVSQGGWIVLMAVRC
jgi:hypothetical protein